MRLLSVLAIALGLSCPALARAQVVSSPLTLDAAVAAAFARNPELVTLRSEFDVARSAPVGERFLMPPMFEAQLWGWPLTTLNPVKTEMYMFMGEQGIPGRGKRAARALVGERQADVARQRVLVRAAEIVGDVRDAYLEAVLARETLSILQRQIPVLHDVADAATARYASGHTGQQDTVRAIGEITRLRADQIMWNERARLAAARLDALLAWPAGTSADASMPPIPDSELVASEVERRALNRHPILAEANAGIAREEAELARLRGDRKPDFVVGGGYMLQPGSAGAWTARAGMTWPNAPWSRGRLNAEITTQEKRVTAAQARHAAAAAGISRGVLTALIRLDAARQRADLLKTATLPHAEHEFGLARVNYAAQRGDFSELLESRRMLLSAEVDRAGANVDILRALSDVSRATGELPEVQP